MPIYEYKCENGHVFDVIQKMSDGSVAVKDVPVDASGRGTLPFSADGIDEATLAVAGTTEGTDQKAAYTARLERP